MKKDNNPWLSAETRRNINVITLSFHVLYIFAYKYIIYHTKRGLPLDFLSYFTTDSFFVWGYSTKMASIPVTAASQINLLKEISTKLDTLPVILDILKDIAPKIESKVIEEKLDELPKAASLTPI